MNSETQKTRLPLWRIVIFCLFIIIGYAMGIYSFRNHPCLLFNASDIGKGRPETVQRLQEIHRYLRSKNYMDQWGYMDYSIRNNVTAQQKVLLELQQENFFKPTYIAQEKSSVTVKNYVDGLYTLQFLVMLNRKLLVKQEFPKDISQSDLYNSLTVWILTFPHGYISGNELGIRSNIGSMNNLLLVDSKRERR